MWKHQDNRTHEKTFCGRGDAHPNEWRAVAKAYRFQEPRGVQCGEEGIGTGGKWVDCVWSDIRASDIAGGWKETALETKVWIKTVREGCQRF